MADAITVKLDFESLAAIRAASNAKAAIKGVETAAKDADGVVKRFGEALNNVGSSSLVGYTRTALDMGAAVRDGAIAHEQAQAQIRAAGPAYQAMAAATRGAITASQALAVQQRFQSAQLRVNKDDFGLVARAAREYAIATGTDASEALNTLTSAITSNDRTALQPFGISLRRNTTATQGLRDALRQLEQQQRNTAPAAQTLQEANDQLARSWTDLTGTIFASIARWADLQSNIAGVADAIRQVTAAHGDLSVAAGGGRERQESAAGTAAMEARLAQQERYTRNVERLQASGLAGATTARFGRGSTMSAAQLQAANARIERMLSGPGLAMRGEHAGNVLSFARGDGEPVAGTRSESGPLIGLTDDLPSISEIARDTLSTEEGNLALRAQRDAARARDARVNEQRRVANRGSSAQGSYDSSLFDFIDQLRELARVNAGTPLSGLGGVVDEDEFRYGMNREQLQPLIDALRTGLGGETARRIRRRPGEGADAYQARLVAAISADAEQTRTGRAGKTAADYETGVAGAGVERERILAARAMDPTSAAGVIDEGLGGKIAGFRESQEALARSQDLGSQFRDQFLPAAEQTRTAAEKMAEGVKGAFDTMSGAIASHVQALIEGRESFGEAMKGIVHDTLLGLAQQAVPRALMETAQGIAALTNPVTAPTAPMHFAAAGVYAGVAALAGLGAAATAPSAGAAQAQAGAGARIAPAASAGQLGAGGSSGPAVITINVNGAVVDREGFEQAIAQGVRGAQSRGLLAA